MKRIHDLLLFIGALPLIYLFSLSGCGLLVVAGPPLVMDLIDRRTRPCRT